MSDKTIRCAVIDDEYLSVKLLADYVQKTPGLLLVLQTTKAAEVPALIRQEQIDLVFLDIQMPEINGLELMKIIGDTCKVIFTTAYPQYALDSYEHNAVDYLLKPITFDRFQVAIKKAKERLAHHEPVITIKKPADHIFIKTEYRIQKVDLSAIYYIEGLRDYIAVHTSSGKILTLESMKNMEELLPADQFIRIHKSYIISKSKIDFLSRGKVVLNNVYLPVGDTYKERFQQSLGI